MRRIKADRSMAGPEEFNKKNIEDIFGLTPLQEGMLFYYLENPQSDLFFEQLCLDISGSLDRDLFEHAWKFVVENNEMLRTVFRWEEVKNPVQVVLKEHTLKPIYYDFTGRAEAEKPKLLEEALVSDRRDKFDLRAVPFRVTLARKEEKNFSLILSHHHILYDGWSTGIILKEFLEAYRALYLNVPLERPLKKTFGEFARRIHRQDPAVDEEKWQDYLKDPGTDGKNRLPPGGRPGRGFEDIKKLRVPLSEETGTRLEEFVKKHKTTPASVLYGAWAILLQKYNGRDDVLFDTTASGRSVKIKGIENVVGLFINTLPLRVKAQDDESVSDLLHRVYSDLQEREGHERVPPVHIKEWIKRLKQGLFDSLVVIENYPLDVWLRRGGQDGGLSIDSFSNLGMSNYDVTLLVTIFDHIELIFVYYRALFAEEDILKMHRDYTRILDFILDNPLGKPAELRLLSKKDKKLQAALEERRNSRPGEEAGNYAAPQNVTEVKLTGIFSRVFDLDRHRIGIDTSFFDLGGHSLTASVLVSEITKEFNVKVPLVEVFRRNTIRELAKYITLSAEEAYIPIEKVEKKEYYPLSSAQKRMFTMHQVEAESTAFNMPQVCALEGKLEAGRLEKTFRQLIQRHDSFRTSFTVINGEPVQVIRRQPDFKIEMYDLAARDPGAKNGETTGDTGDPLGPPVDRIIRDFTRPFDLSRPPLLRVGLIPLSPTPSTHEGSKSRGTYILMVDMHHIVSDGISYYILLQDFIKSYRGETLPPLRLQYNDYAQWQSTDRYRQKSGEQAAYWLDLFDGDIPVLHLPTDHPPSAARSFRGDTIHFHLDSELTDRIEQLMAETGTTLFMVLLAVYNVLLGIYTRQQDIVIGTPVAGRIHPDLQNIIGMFVNMLVMRNRPRRDKTFKEFLEEVKRNAFGAWENQDYQFDELVNRKGLQGSGFCRNPLFSVAFTVQNINSGDWRRGLNHGENGDLKLIPHRFNSRISKFDLLFVAEKIHDRIEMFLEYSIDLFERTTAEKMVEHYISLLKQAVENRGAWLQDMAVSHHLRTVNPDVYQEDQGDFNF